MSRHPFFSIRVPRGRRTNVRVSKLLFAVHAVFPEAFGKGVGIDLQLCDLRKETQLYEMLNLNGWDPNQSINIALLCISVYTLRTLLFW